jgi:hypothetical protein
LHSNARRKFDATNKLTAKNFVVKIYQNEKSTMLNIQYIAVKNQKISLSILTADCQKIQQLCDEKQKEGLQQIFYDISFLPQGSYIIELNGKQKMITKT